MWTRVAAPCPLPSSWSHRRPRPFTAQALPQPLGASPPPAAPPRLSLPDSRGPRTPPWRDTPAATPRVPGASRAPSRRRGRGRAQGPRLGPSPAPHLPRSAAPSGRAGQGGGAEILAEAGAAAPGGRPRRRPLEEGPCTCLRGPRAHLGTRREPDGRTRSNASHRGVQGQPFESMLDPDTPGDTPRQIYTHTHSHA